MSFGQGSYFAKNSNYSDQYAIRDINGQKTMIRTRILAGLSCVGNSTMKTPPTLYGRSFNTTTNSDKSIFVCYNDYQAYPEYLIKYF